MDRRTSSSSSFLAILDEAQANTQRASAVVRELNHATARDRERQAKQDRIRRQLEHEQKLRRKQAEKLSATCQHPLPGSASSSTHASHPPTGERRVLKKSTTPVVDPQGVAAFLRKQANERRRVEEQKRIEKLNLIQKRIEAHGGKASKKIAGQFGATAMDLQMRYGSAHGHMETLRKNETREREEEDRLRDQWSATVANTIAKKKGARASADGGDCRDSRAATQPTAFNSQKKRPPAVVPVPDRSAVATQKRPFSQSDRSRDESNASIKRPKIHKTTLRRGDRGSGGPGAPVDFTALMNHAAAIQRRREDVRRDEEGEGESERSPSPMPTPVVKRKQESNRPGLLQSVASPIDDVTRRSKPEMKGRDYGRGEGSASRQVAMQFANRKAKGVEKEDRPQRRLETNEPREQMQTSITRFTVAQKKDERRAERAGKDTNAIKSAVAGGRDGKTRLPQSNTPSQQKKNSFVAPKALSSGDIRSRLPPPRSPSPPPVNSNSGISTTSGARRFLPGDLRYRGETSSSKMGVIGSSRVDDRRSNDKAQLPASQLPGPSSVRPLPSGGGRGTPKERLMPPPSSGTAPRGQDRRFAPSANDISIAKIRACERLRMEQRAQMGMERLRAQQQHGSSNSRNASGPPRALARRESAASDDEEEEEEVDSEMEDFIDDDPLLDDDLQRQEFEDTLKMLNPRYDKKRWRERERAIDLRGMESNYRQIADEERRSARLGLIEDIKEAGKRGSTKL